METAESYTASPELIRSKPVNAEVIQHLNELYMDIRKHLVIYMRADEDHILQKHGRLHSDHIDRIVDHVCMHINDLQSAARYIEHLDEENTRKKSLWENLAQFLAELKQNWSGAKRLKIIRRIYDKHDPDFQLHLSFLATLLRTADLYKKRYVNKQ